MGLAIIMGLAAAFNILVIFKKIELKRYQDATFDSAFLVLLTLVFGGSLGGMMVATVASAVISLYFLFNEPKFLSSSSEEEEEEEEEAQSSEPSVDDILAKYNLHKVEFS